MQPNIIPVHDLDRSLIERVKSPSSRLHILLGLFLIPTIGLGVAALLLPNLAMFFMGAIFILVALHGFLSFRTIEREKQISHYFALTVLASLLSHMKDSEDPNLVRIHDLITKANYSPEFLALMKDFDRSCDWIRNLYWRVVDGKSLSADFLQTLRFIDVSPQENPEWLVSLNDKYDVMLRSGFAGETEILRIATIMDRMKKTYLNQQERDSEELKFAYTELADIMNIVSGGKTV